MQTSQRKTRTPKVLAIYGWLAASASILVLLLSACGDNTPTPTVLIPTEIPATIPATVASTSALITIPPAATPGPTATPANSAAETSSPPSGNSATSNPIKGVDGQDYWVVDPIRPFYDANPWLGLPLGGMKQARSDGYNWDGLYQNFQRGRVEAHLGQDGKYILMLGLVNQELLESKKNS